MNGKDPIAAALDGCQSGQTSTKAEQELGDWSWLMGDSRGRRIVFAQIRDARVFNIVFSADALAMAFNEGNRNSGLRLLHIVMRHCPDEYLTMMKENRDE